MSPRNGAATIRGRVLFISMCLVGRLLFEFRQGHACHAHVELQLEQAWKYRALREDTAFANAYQTPVTGNELGIITDDNIHDCHAVAVPHRKIISCVPSYAIGLNGAFSFSTCFCHSHSCLVARGWMRVPFEGRYYFPQPRQSLCGYYSKAGTIRRAGTI